MSNRQETLMLGNAGAEKGRVSLVFFHGLLVVSEALEVYRCGSADAGL